MAISSKELAGIRLVAGDLRKIVDAALVAGRERTGGGKSIDDHQAHTERLAYLATEVEAVESMVEYAEKAAGRDSFAVETAAIFTAMVTSRARTQAFEQGPVFGVGQDLIDEALNSDAARDFVRAGLDDRRIEALGRQVIEAGTT
ncbi:MAG: acyl-CoA dehydrogenase family protein, partial [bacterium]